MGSRKARIVIIGAGMAGLTAANELFTSPKSHQLFDLTVVEGGVRIGGRIKSSEFAGDRIEEGATWIHGIDGSPIYRIAQERNLLHSHHPWEYMDSDDAIPENTLTVAEGGHELSPSLVRPVSGFFKNLVKFSQGKAVDGDDGATSRIVKNCDCGGGNASVGSFYRRGFEAYRGSARGRKGVECVGNWSGESLEEAVFTMHENAQRCYMAVDDLGSLDFDAEREYKVFPGVEITVARGYSSVVEYLASVLPVGMIQLGRKVVKIEWRPNLEEETGDGNTPVKLHFIDGSTMWADHVIVTVSLGVLKRGIVDGFDLFDPPLPSFKNGAISRLGYGVADKVFLQLQDSHNDFKFPSLQMVFHRPDSELRNPKIPNWIRKSSNLYPIRRNSRVVLVWFAGKEALEIESLTEEEIIDGVSETVSDLFSSKSIKPNGKKLCSGSEVKFERVLRTQWGTNPLFLGAYSYVAVGSSGDDMDILAQPLPGGNSDLECSSSRLQILFAGEATHRTHYSTTHGAYLSGIREANRLLKHYKCHGV